MKDFISKHHKLLIILLVILVVILVIAILLFDSKDSSNVIPRDPYELLLVNIDDLDYNLNDVYYSEFTLIDGMNSYQVEAELRFSEDNTCEYSSTWYSEIGTYTFSSTKCNYETGEGNNLKVTMNGTLQLYNNYIMDYQTEEISDYVLNGIYKYENKSHLLLSGITYEHFDYYTYSHYGVNEVLVDYTGEIYKPDGSKFWAEDGNKIDLNLYKIIDKRQNNNNASRYVNEYDISELNTSGTIMDVGFIKSCNESYLISSDTIYLVVNNINAIKSVFLETPNYYFVYISSLCNENAYNLEKELKPLIDEYQLQNNFYFLDVTNIKDSNLNYKKDIALALDIDQNVISDIPIILYFKDGKLQNDIFTAEEFKNILEAN